MWIGVMPALMTLRVQEAKTKENISKACFIE